MYAKSAVGFAVLAALMEPALAANAHRHLHASADKEKRGVVTEWVTAWKTEIVGGAPTAAADAPVVVAVNKKEGIKESAPPVADVPSTTLAVQVVKSTDAPAANNNTVAGGKRGIAYNDANLANSFGSACSGCSWAYNWDSSANGLDPSIEFVPMLWGDLPVHTNKWDKAATASLNNGAKALFSFNEPDNGGQANMTPEAAAAAHIKYMNPYKDKALIGAPSITNSGLTGEGVQWLSGFLAACNGKCYFDFCNAHWYSEAQYSNTLFDHLQKINDLCKKPVWLTEFAPVGNPADAAGFIKTVIPQLDSLSYLQRYSYFMVSAGKLMGSGNSLSSDGQIYASV